MVQCKLRARIREDIVWRLVLSIGCWATGSDPPTPQPNARLRFSARGVVSGVHEGLAEESSLLHT